MTNSNAKAGDVLILTKPIGTGIISTGIKRGLTDKKTETEAIRVMSELNNVAADVIKEFPVNACTDVTGFGLLGHLKEMTTSSKTDVELYCGKIPVIEGVMELAAENVIPGGTINNMDFVSDVVVWDDGISNTEKAIFCDAQTSGGLLISVPQKSVNEVLMALKERDLKYASVIGKVVNIGTGKIFLRI